MLKSKKKAHGSRLKNEPMTCSKNLGEQMRMNAIMNKIAKRQKAARALMAQQFQNLQLSKKEAAYEK